VDTGYFWLSATPEHPGKGWDAKFSRICTWAKLRPKDGGKVFCYFALHLDHQGQVSRLESIRLVLRKIDEFSGGAPTILAGDFNSDQNSETYQMLARSRRLTDSAKIAEVCYLLNGTTNGFNPNRGNSSRIDHVFVSAGTHVRRFGVLTDSYRIPKAAPEPEKPQSGDFPADVKIQDYDARLPSDHFPVFVEITNP
jgi:endonuclease/exonuclease/phosphatase family metal-dependent hydrolase